MKTVLVILIGLTPLAVIGAGRVWTVGGPASDFPFITPALAAAADGDTLRVAPGVYREDLMLDRRIALIGLNEGAARPRLFGRGSGSIITVRAAGCEIRGFDLEGSGTGLTQRMDAGVTITSDDNKIADNRMRRVYFGVVVHNGTRNEILNNDIEGLFDQPFGRRGDGIYFFRSPGNLARGNRVAGMRDAIYLQYAPDSRVLDNVVTASRYGLHDMHADRAELHGNSFSGCSVGANIMNCRKVRLIGNRFAGNRGIGAIGLSFKECDESTVEDNDFLDNARGLQVEGASRNRFARNRFAFNDVAVQLFASAEENVFTENQFHDNLTPLFMAGNRSSNRWSEQGRGNSWDAYRGFDFNGDGAGEQPMALLGPFEKIEGNNFAARLFLRSPAAAALEWTAPADAAREDVTDPHPLTPRRDHPGDAVRPSWLTLLLPAGAAALAGALLRRVRPC